MYRAFKYVSGVIRGTAAFHSTPTPPQEKKLTPPQQVDNAYSHRKQGSVGSTLPYQFSVGELIHTHITEATLFSSVSFWLP